MKNNNKYLAKLSIPYMIWMAIFILLPMFLVLMYSITENTDGTFNITFTFDHYLDFFRNSIYTKALYRSIRLALIATIITLILGYPVAFFVSLFKPKIRNLLLLLLVLPMWTNMLLRTYAWRYILEDKGLINSLLGSLGLPAIKMINTGFSVSLGMTYNYLPFMILPIFSVLIKMDKDLISASYDLGANKFQTFIRIIFPLSLSGVASGITLVFLPAATSFIIPAYLGGGKQNLIGNIIENMFKSESNNPNLGSALSIILMIFIFGFLWLMSIKSKNKESGESLW